MNKRQGEKKSINTSQRNVINLICIFVKALVFHFFTVPANAYLYTNFALSEDFWNGTERP